MTGFQHATKLKTKFQVAIPKHFLVTWHIYIKICYLNMFQNHKFSFVNTFLSLTLVLDSQKKN